jgi:hypothetical protein
MYFLGPLIWGWWIVFRLKIFALDQFLHSITSPITLLLLCSFFAYNLNRYFNTISSVYKRSVVDALEIRKKLLSLFILHQFSIVLFGIVATQICIFTELFPQLGFYLQKSNTNYLSMATAALSGGALVLLFYVNFNNILIKVLNGVYSYAISKEDCLISIKKQLGLFTFIPSSLGLILLYITGIFGTINALNEPNSMLLGNKILSNLIAVSLTGSLGMGISILWAFKILKK